MACCVVVVVVMLVDGKEYRIIVRYPFWAIGLLAKRISCQL